MWTRRELKERAKAAFRRNYWKCVLVAFILALLVGGGAGSGLRKSQNNYTQEQQQAIHELATEGESDLQRAFFGLVDQAASQNSRVTISLGGLGLVGLALSLLVFNPLIVGCYRFFLQNSRGGAELNELGAGFKDDWGNVILVMFLRNLFIALWSLLFVIPGIVKAYSYRMVPYLLKDHPELSGTQVITISRQMMKGHKADAFVLDLSFIGWLILSVLTCGILHIFWVGPYIQATDAELYEAVRTEYESRMGLN